MVSSLQAAHVFQPVLLEDGGQVGLGHVVGKGAVAEDHVVSPAGASSLCHATIPSASGSTSAAAICSARQTSSVPAPMLWTVLPAMVFCSMGTVRSRPSLSSSSKRMSCSVRSVFRCSADSSSVFGKVLAVRFPRPDVAGGELEDAEAEVAREQRVLFFDLLPSPAQAFFGQFGDIAGLAEFVAEFGGNLLLFALRVERLRKLNENIASDRRQRHFVTMTACAGRCRNRQRNPEQCHSAI